MITHERLQTGLRLSPAGSNVFPKYKPIKSEKTKRRVRAMSKEHVLCTPAGSSSDIQSGDINENTCVGGTKAYRCFDYRSLPLK